MTPKELKIELEAMKCPIHDGAPRIRIVRGTPFIYLCCCREFRKELEAHINSKKEDLSKSALLPHSLSEEQIARISEQVRSITPLIISIRDAISSRKPYVTFPSEALSVAKRAFNRLLHAENAQKSLIDELGEIIADADKAKYEVSHYAQLLRDEKIALIREKDRIKREKLREKEKVRKAKERAEKRKLEKEINEHREYVLLNLSKWKKSVEAMQKFVEENDSNSYLAILSEDDLQRVIRLANILLEATTPLKDACNRHIEDDELLKLYKSYTTTADKVHNIVETCYKLIKIKTIKSSHKPKSRLDKQRDNKRDDIRYFRKMSRLIDEKLHSTDKWYENESRHFNISQHEDAHEYLDAYGRTIRSNLRKAEIIVEGREDIDEWGYFNLGNKYLPYCLREVKVISNNIEYHLYTFNTMPSMDDYDYDGMITDRIIYLQDKGIKTN